MAFGRSKSDDNYSSGNTVAPVQINMIGRGTKIVGEFNAQSDTSISGKVEGKVHVDGRLMITADGLVEGEIHATHADIGGHIKGDVHVKERLCLKGTCVVDGNISTGKLVIEDGAIFTGKCSMNPSSNAGTTSKKSSDGSTIAPKVIPSA